MAQQSQSANEKVAKLKQEALKQKLEGILQKSHDESRSNSLQQKQHGDVLSENTTLKHRLSDLQGKLYTKDVEMSHLEGDLAGSKREVSYAQQELALERQQKDAMKTKMNTLEHQLRDRERVLSDIQDAADVIVANNDPAQQKELASLKAKYVVKLMQVGELEGENSVLQQQLNFIAEQRDTLEADLDTSNTHIAALEAQVVKERSVASEARTAIDSLRDEYILKQEDIQREKLHCGELERDVVTLRKDLKSSQLNVSSLQNELITLQDENERCNADLSKMSNHAADMERKLLATTESLRNFQNLSTKCQESITAAQLDLKRVKSKLEAEKQTNTQLQAEVNSLTEDLESSERRVEGRNAQYTQTRTDLSRKTVELQELQQANHSLKVEIGQLQAVSTALQGDLEVRDTTVKSLERELAQTKEVLSATKQQLGVSNRDVTTCKRQIEEYQVQLNESDTETAKLMRDVKICGNEIQGLKSKLATANSSLAEKKVSLERKEDEMRVLKQEKIMLTTELSESKREFHSMASVKNRLENDLEIMSSRLEMERTRIGEMQQDLNTRTQECKSLQLEMGKVLQELGYEKDLNMTLGKEHTSVKAKFLAANEQCENLQQRFQHLQMESKAKSQSNKEGMSKLEAELGQISQQCKTLKERQSKLETESAQYKDLLKKASGEVSETKAKLSMKTTALDTAIEYKEKVCKQLDAARRQLEISADTVANKETELQKCRAELSMHQSQLADALKENGRYKRQLNIERANGTKLQGDIGKLQETLTSLTVQMEQVKEEREYDRRRVEDLTNDVAMSQTKNHELTRDLHKALDELNEMQHESTEARTSFSRTIASLKSSHEEEQTSLQAENNGLRTELTQMKEKLCRKGLELDNCENRLGVCAGKLSSTDQKCIRLENSLKSQEEKFASLESRYINLESTHTAQSSDLNKRLKCQTAMSQQLRIHLESMEKECSALKEKLQVQREAAATSLNKIQKEHQANSTELHAKIRELSNNIEEAHDALRGTQQELSRVKTQNATLTSSISAETEKNRKLKEQFHDQMTALKLVEQNVEQLRVANEMEKTAKDRLKDSLSEENSRRRSCEITIEEQKKRIAIVTRDLTQCQNSLNKERAAMVNLNMETQNTCDELLRAKQQVDSLKQEMKKREMQGERELAALKQKYHGDKKSLKEKIKDLQTTQNCLTADCETRGAEVSRLQTSNQILAEDHMAALKKLSSLEHKLQDKREECGNLKVKLQAFEVQIRQLQSEVTTLEHGRLQLDELKKKSDAKSKIEMQRVLAEVTDHMEQQYSAHKYLEKLRTENEVIAIKEKEKTISQLKKELKQKKQDCKQDKVQLEQLQLETSFLKNQQMEQDRSRRRLEARLEQVNDTLSSSLPIKPVCSHSFQCLHPMDPQYTSTPTRTPKRSF